MVGSPSAPVASVALWWPAGGLLVEGTGCPTFCKVCVGTAASESCDGLTMRALLVVKAQPSSALE